jgi:hypothetical protein
VTKTAAALAASALAGAAVLGPSVPVWVPFVATAAVLAVVVVVVVRATRPAPAPSAAPSEPLALPAGDRWQLTATAAGDDPVLVTTVADRSTPA